MPLRSTKSSKPSCTASSVSVRRQTTWRLNSMRRRRQARSVRSRRHSASAQRPERARFTGLEKN
jgi:hypothetical protein